MQRGKPLDQIAILARVACGVLMLCSACVLDESGVSARQPGAERGRGRVVPTRFDGGTERDAPPQEQIDAGEIPNDASEPRDAAGSEDAHVEDAQVPDASDACVCGDSIRCGDEECDDGKLGSRTCFHDCRRSLLVDDAVECGPYATPFEGVAIIPSRGIEPSPTTWSAPIDTVINLADIFPSQDRAAPYAMYLPERVAQFDDRPGSDVHFTGENSARPSVTWEFLASSDGLGGFVAPQVVGSNASIGAWITEVIHGDVDFNGDQRPDSISCAPFVLYTPGSELRAKEVLLSPSSDGADRTRVPMELGLYANQLSFADLNGDGKTDLYHTYQGVCGWSIVVALSLGDGHWSAAHKEHIDSLQLPIFRARAVDVTGDGAADLVRIYPSDAGLMVEIALNRGDGRFSTPVKTFGNAFDGGPIVFPSSASLLFGDVNGDAKTDLLFLAPSGDHIGVTSYASKGDGHTHYFNVSGDTIPAGTPPEEIRVLDLNGDRQADLLIKRAADNAVAFGRGDGSFAELQSLPQGAIHAGDFNADGKMDILSALTIDPVTFDKIGGWKFTTLLAE